MKIEAESKADHATKPLEKMLQESLKNSDSVHALRFAQVKTLTLCFFSLSYLPLATAIPGL